MNTHGISIVTGTLNRRPLLPAILANTVLADERLELVLVDGGSTDGTLDYLKNINHPRVKLIEIGGRSPYPHFMNIGIRSATHEHICQWNDDVFLTCSWDDVFRTIDDEHAVYIFTWKNDKYPKFKDKGWVIIDSLLTDPAGEVVVNFGIYRKEVFRKVGLYNPKYHFYCADGDMAHRAFYNGFKIKSCPEIKVVSIRGIAKNNDSRIKADIACYKEHIATYKTGILPDYLEYLE